MSAHPVADNIPVRVLLEHKMSLKIPNELIWPIDADIEYIGDVGVIEKTG